MKCKKAQFLMSLYIADDPDLTSRECGAFEEHLQNCQKCAKEYKKSKFIIELAKEHWQVSANTLSLIEKAAKPYKPKMTVEEGWEDLKRRIPELAQLEKCQKYLQLFHKVGAVAACLAIGISIFLVFSIYSKTEVSNKSISQQVELAPKNSITVELMTENGSVRILTAKEISSGNELKTLLINDKHRIVTNVNTTLSIQPFAKGHRKGCMVSLAEGEVFAHVEHDGNLFVVSTAHGTAAITGTTFDVRTTDIRTTLVVTEGAVQFKSEEGLVEVAAGQISEIVGQSAPTKPILCNTTKLTAWATSCETKTVLAGVQPVSDAYDLTNLWVTTTTGPINLEAIDYNDWIKEKRDWFKKDFPWIFQLKDALANEGMEVDYPELLIQSGDIWQFVYPESSSGRIPVINPDSLLKTTLEYGFEKRWLLKNVPPVKFAIDAPAEAGGQFTSLNAYEEWAKCFERAKQGIVEELNSDTILYSLHAGTYLTNTRTLAWLTIRNGQCAFKAKDKKVDVSALLQREVNTSRHLIGKTIKLLWESQSQPCDEYWELLQAITEDISAIMTIEKRISEYEVCE